VPRDSFDKIDEDYYSTVLDENFVFKGIIKFDESSLIKGRIDGKIESKGKLIIGPDAVINADITAKSLECFGRINGNVIIEEEAYFHSPSSLTGSLKASLLTFEKGCSLNGKVTMPQMINEEDEDEDDLHEEKNVKLRKNKTDYKIL
jgi:cytoskeletal protein CcmA (bactofilin family)